MRPPLERAARTQLAEATRARSEASEPRRAAACGPPCRAWAAWSGRKRVTLGIPVTGTGLPRISVPRSVPSVPFRLFGRKDH